MVGKSAPEETFHDRLFQAWSLWQGRHKRKLSQTELGEMVGKAGGEAVSQSTVSDWFKTVVPSVGVVEYLAKALEVDPGWLAFGPASEAPAPDAPAALLAQPATRSKGQQKRA